MPKTPSISGEEAVRAFKRAGFSHVRTNGSHFILKKAAHPFHLSIPVHKGKKLGKGLLIAQISASGLTLQEFIDLL